MLRALREWLAARFERRNADTDAESRFVPSRLDASVLFAHGRGADEGEREIVEIEEEARALEEPQREN